MPLTKKIAIVDEDVATAQSVKSTLEAEGYQVSFFGSASEALVKFKREQPHILITGLRMKDIDGLMFMRKVHEDFPRVIMIMMTAFGSVESAIEAMKLGAYHYLVKPFKMEEISHLVRRGLERSALVSENVRLKKELQKEFTLEKMVGKSPVMLELFELIKRIAPAHANVLIQGESGTGKELVARAIHAYGTRKVKSFVPVNCTAIPETLLETELFGHVKGSFTGAYENKKGLFEEADGGTLFLDEIGDLSLPMQAKLLRVLQDKMVRPVGGNEPKQVDVRIVCATHRNLKAMVAEGQFREDLYYRLNVIPIHVPSLRERPQDIPILVQHVVEKYALLDNSKVKGVTPQALAALMAHPWPGNVRELENVIERAVVLAKNELIDVEEVMGTALENAKANFQQLLSDFPTLEKLEERYIRMVLTHTENRKEEAAKILGISRRTLYRKERVYGLIPEDAVEPEFSESSEPGNGLDAPL